MSEPTDEDDVARSLRGDGEAFARIIARHQVQIARRMRRFSRQPLVIEELVQEVFVEAYHSLTNYRAKGVFAAWLDRIAARTGYRYWKRRDRAKEVDLDSGWWLTLTERPMEQLGAGQAAALVHSLLAELPPRDRLVLLLLYVEGRSAEEAASLAGWSKTMVHVQAFRAKARVRALLAKRGVESLAEAVEFGVDPKDDSHETKLTPASST